MQEAESGISNKSSSTPPTRSKPGWPVTLDLLAGLAAAVVLALALHAWLATSPTWVTGTAVAYVALASVVYGFWTAGRIQARRRVDFGWANRVTLFRAVLVAVLAGVLTAPEIARQHGMILASLALVAIVLDGLDGWLARAVDEASRFGARFDMEVDALLILVLSIAVLLADRAGWWVLLIGGMRYAFVASGRLLPWLRRDLPPSTWRKAVCIAQSVVLAAALLPGLSGPLIKSVLALSLAALVHSFGRDTLWLWRRRAA